MPAAAIITIIAALLTVLVGWPLELYVSTLNVERNKAIDSVLAEDNPTPQMLGDAADAKLRFTVWHLLSLGLSILGVGLVTGGMALAARLPVHGGAVARAEK